MIWGIFARQGTEDDEVVRDCKGEDAEEDGGEAPAGKRDGAAVGAGVRRDWVHDDDGEVH